jgi:MFS superfamily sulfate permease-like transporter
MLAGIGIIIILKQLPHAFGYDADFEGDLSFVQKNGENSISSLFEVFNHIQVGAVIITAVSFLILISWDKVRFLKKLKLIPGALIAVISSIVLNEIFKISGSSLVISNAHLVSLPAPTSFDEFKGIIVTPDFSGFLNPKVWIIGLTIAIVASIETLLCIEAADRMDPQKRYTDTNVELKAHGLGNILSSLIGGLPMTSVVVRSSANNNAGAKSKMSAIIHGVLLLISVLTIPVILNRIPLATLATILILVGYKLAKPTTFKHFWKKGKYQFIPFIATLVAVVTTDLLKGVLLGIIISIIFILRGNLKRAYSFNKEEFVDGDIIHIDLAQEVSFLNKAAIKATLKDIPENSKVIINADDTVYIAHDILDLIREFKETRAIDENIKVKLRGFKKVYDLDNSPDFSSQVSFEHYYDVAKRIMVKKKVVKEVFKD